MILSETLLQGWLQPALSSAFRHYAGVEKSIRTPVALRQKLGPTLNIAPDAEYGVAASNAASRTQSIASIIHNAGNCLNWTGIRHIQSKSTQYNGVLHDYASYRYYWTILKYTKSNRASVPAYAGILLPDKHPLAPTTRLPE